MYNIAIDKKKWETKASTRHNLSQFLFFTRIRIHADLIILQLHKIPAYISCNIV